MSDPQSEWAEVLLASLAEAGLVDVIISPGSRSTPLVWAACQIPGFRRHALIDERSAAFFALGQARVSGIPSLLICTSGTAPSHYYPAVIEAKQSGVPLIVLSADRPFELQECGAPQTVDQARLFGNYATYYELGTPVADAGAVLGLRRMARQAFATAIEAPRGAVHLNFRAKKPLEPALGERQRAPASRPSQGVRVPGPVPRAIDPSDISELVRGLTESTCPLLICGALSLQDSPPAELVQRFAQASGSIVCPESVSQLRFQLDAVQGDAVVCDAYEWLLSSAPFARALAPDFALQLGAAPLSAALGRLLGDSQALNFSICAETGWPDPLHKAARIVRGRPNELLEALCRALEGRPRPVTAARRLWQRAGGWARQLVNEQLELGFGEPEAVSGVAASLPPGSLLVLGNSLPPRLVDRYCPAAARGIRVVSQRGASGIDGLVAGALGSASQTLTPTTLLLGDISFLHDVGSLWAARAERVQTERPRQPLVVVVINNGGGRIFEQLPIAERSDVEHELWTTPHAVELRGAAQLYGLAFRQARDRAELQAALAQAYGRAEVSLIEVVVEPHSAAVRSKQLASVIERRAGEVLAELP
ncbi:MAG TPA: 2-succinyl-5-enolpyruvyl-6-hydroxy-3-cyclohexene-1-carboxylic-acid synthase [Polyangiaceae bacterium]|nr:2-succinyl-5-enolpyruvyl-6-hydroxy-3-cyclohexene-1-carboxylic-acid synthase [Polyangiaceae bacterium]